VITCSRHTSRGKRLFGWQHLSEFGSLLYRVRPAVPRPDWSRPLPRPLTIPDVLTLETLTDVRTLVEKHLPAEYRSKFTWRQLAGLLKRAAEGQVAEVSTALRILLHVRFAGAHAAA
jgi:hypothetical protein